MEYFRQGNSQFVDEDYEDAVESYTSAIKELPTSANPFLNRGAALLKLKKYYEALEDFNSAIALNADLELAYYRKGVVYFELEEFESAKKTFETGLKLRKASATKRDQTLYLRYIRKCDAELSEDATITPSKADTVKASPAAKPAVAVAAAAAAPAVTPKPAAPTPAANAPVGIVLPIRYQYYQSDSTLNISVLTKNLTADDVVVDIQPEHLRVVIKYRTHGGESREEVVIDKPLYASVDITKSKFAILKPKVEITLVKIEKEVWPTLDHTGAPRLPRPEGTPAPTVEDNSMDVEGASSSSGVPAAKRPKPYASAKDWDKVGSEIEAELEKDKKEGDEALNDLFAKIYKDADQETKMAMKKSFQTSGGTVLSTNWKEVKEKDYEKEKQAPKGMEWRNWEGDRLPQKDDD